MNRDGSLSCSQKLVCAPCPGSDELSRSSRPNIRMDVKEMVWVHEPLCVCIVTKGSAIRVGSTLLFLNKCFFVVFL